MMKLFRLATSVVIAVMLASNGSARAASAVPAFPGAEGFGATTVGGRGGKVYEVTNTNDSGAGSLRNCVQATGARICIFKTGGLITLKSPLVINHPYITIAGQTAPGGGITIRMAPGSSDAILTAASEVIMRYISVRPGPGGENHGNQIAANGVPLHNILIDHSTFSWGVDSDLETWYRVYNMTIQWSIISEALDCSTHSKGCHSKGLMIGGYAGSESKNSVGSEDITVHHNLMAQDVDRTPLMQLCGTAQVINNVTYNPQYTFSHQQNNCIVPDVEWINWVGNYHKKGPDSTEDTDLKVIPADDGKFSGGAKVYVSGNIGPSRPSTSQPESNWVDPESRQFIVSTAAPAPAVTTTDAVTAYNAVLANAGNSKGLACDGSWVDRRDSIDTRVVNDVQNGTGHIIDDPSQVGGWITPASGTPCLDSDHDGMPDAWETKYGLDPANPLDGRVDTDGDGYTNLEEYLNGTDPGTGATVTSMALTSIAGQDGLIVESSPASSRGGAMNSSALTFSLGDNTLNRQYRAILSFNTTLPANAVISAVTLKIRGAGLVGANPFGSLGNILVDVCSGAFSGNPLLQLADFQAPSSRDAALTIGNHPVNGWYSASLGAANFSTINRAGITQFRLRFAKGDNGNSVANYLKFFSGNVSVAASRPVLTLRYYVP